MNLHKLILTESKCYKAGKTIIPKGIMVHSTGANNPNLKRYVGPDDGLLGVNEYNNHWNTPGKSVCPHAAIGLLADGTVASYQLLPWNHRSWHAGTGKKGSANNTHISFEICEDGLKDPVYFGKVYQEAVELCAYLCRLYGFDPLADGVIIDHSEGCDRGLASNHGDVAHWFPKFGKSMDTLRADVAARLNGYGSEETPVVKEESKSVEPSPVKTVKAASAARYILKTLAGTYTVTASALNVRHGAGILKKKMVTIPRGTKVKCYGYYSTSLGAKWLCVQFTYQGVSYTGFCHSKYLKKV